MMIVAIYLLACIAAGWAVTYWSGAPLRLEERVVFGMVLGPMSSTMATLLLALVLGASELVILAGLVLVLVLGGIAVWRQRQLVVDDARDLGDRWGRPFKDSGHPWPLVAILAVSWPYTIHVLRQAYVFAEDGLYAGHLSSWADWSAHSSYAGAFSTASRLPPDLPVASGEPFRYHFMVDLFAGNLSRLGISLQSALELSSLVLAFAFPLVLYLVALRLTGSRAAAALTVPVFLLAGGLGFTYFFADLDQKGFSVLRNLPHEYAGMWDRNYQMNNTITGHLYPQRPALFGFSIALIAVALLWQARKEWRVAGFVFAGVLVGLTPLFHGFAFVTMVSLGGSLALLDRRREWLGFLVPAVALALPAVLWLMPPESAIRWHPGWLAWTDAKRESLLWFWLKNTGVFIPLLVFAHARRGVLPEGLGRFLVPIWLWFLLPNLLVFHPWEWDNTHYFVYWQLFGSIIVATGLVWLARLHGTGRVLAAACLVVLTFAGALDVLRLGDFNTTAIKLATKDGIDAAAWVRENTSPGAVFALAPVNDEPVLVLGARPVVAGYPGWIWDLGVKDWSRRIDDVKRILRGQDDSVQLLKRYDVDYLVIGPIELNVDHGANVGFWRERANSVYSNAEYEIFDVRGARAGND
jgi:hypothetical protein